MKNKILTLVLILISMPLFAQHALVGTWEMVSLKGTDADGKKMMLNTSVIRETKIITPTHYILIQHDVKGDSLVFKHCLAGTVRLEGNKYIETPVTASWEPPYNNMKMDFTWKLEGDKFIQSGTIVASDGKKTVLDELVFKKVKEATMNSNNPMVGTWDQLSSSFTLADGTKGSHTNATTNRFYVVTPAHWMMIGHKDRKFESASWGTYTMLDKKMNLVPKTGSYSMGNTSRFELAPRLVGDKLYVAGALTWVDGKKMNWDDVFQKVSGATAK